MPASCGLLFRRQLTNLGGAARQPPEPTGVGFQDRQFCEREDLAAVLQVSRDRLLPFAQGHVQVWLSVGDDALDCGTGACR